MRIRLFTGLIGVIAFTGAAGAAPSLEASIGQCAAKTDAEARLACYDAVAAQWKTGQVPTTAAAPVAAALRPALPEPVAAAAPPAAKPPAVKPILPEAQFGAELLPKEVRQATGQPQEADAISAALKSFSYTALGRVIVTLGNGQVWRQIDGDNAKFRAKQGDLITIARGLFGSYNMTVGDHNGLYKVRRVE
jgi:hypothetical protein